MNIEELFSSECICLNLPPAKRVIKVGLLIPNFSCSSSSWTASGMMFVCGEDLAVDMSIVLSGSTAVPTSTSSAAAMVVVREASKSPRL